MIHFIKVSKTFILRSVFWELSTQLGYVSSFLSLFFMSSLLSVSSFLFSQISLLDIFKSVLTQALVLVYLFCCLFFNCFIFVPTFWFTGKAEKLQILNLGSFHGRKFTEYVFSFYKRITHLQPSSFQIHLAAEDQEISEHSSYSIKSHISIIVHNQSIPVY